MCVSFRFYGRLNDFLRFAQRGTAVRHSLPAPSSVKDAIEALGVPHPEVDLILVNGAAELFDYRLRDGDRVAVYPSFRSIDVSILRRAGSNPPSPARFVLDVHLGRLAALLRLAGFDAVLLDDDPGVAEAGSREGRIVLTRDVGLLKRRAVRHGHWVRHVRPELQLIEVLDRFDLAGVMQPFTRCMECNTALEPAAFEGVAAQLPPRVRSSMRRFQRCPGCGRLYWEGTHYDRLARLLAVVRESALARGRA